MSTNPSFRFIYFARNNEPNRRPNPTTIKLFNSDVPILLNCQAIFFLTIFWHNDYYALQDNSRFYYPRSSNSHYDLPLPLALFCHQVNSKVHRTFFHIANTKSFHSQHQLQIYHLSVNHTQKYNYMHHPSDTTVHTKDIVLDRCCCCSCCHFDSLNIISLNPRNNIHLDF